MVIGMIMNWYGEAGTIPPGFAVCDGANGTPDLRDRFIRGAGAGYPPGSTGGANTHTHPFTGDGHFHTLLETAPFLAADSYRNDQSDTKNVTGTTDAGSNIPPYHALLFIMYVGL